MPWAWGLTGQWLCRSVFLAEVLAKGEVPRGARDIWKQRSRWAAAAHMYILTPTSVFWRKQKNMSYWQKSLYWIPMVLHWTLIWAEPIMFSMPIICLGCTHQYQLFTLTFGVF